MGMAPSHQDYSIFSRESLQTLYLPLLLGRGHTQDNGNFQLRDFLTVLLSHRPGVASGQPQDTIAEDCMAMTMNGDTLANRFSHEERMLSQAPFFRGLWSFTQSSEYRWWFQTFLTLCSFIFNPHRPKESFFSNKRFPLAPPNGSWILSSVDDDRWTYFFAGQQLLTASLEQQLSRWCLFTDTMRWPRQAGKSVWSWDVPCCSSQKWYFRCICNHMYIPMHAYIQYFFSIIYNTLYAYVNFTYTSNGDVMRYGQTITTPLLTSQIGKIIGKSSQSWK